MKNLVYRKSSHCRVSFKLMSKKKTTVRLNEGEVAKRLSESDRRYMKARKSIT